MNATDLSRENQAALVALIEAVALSDGLVSEGEEDEIGRVADELGEETYRGLLDEAEERFPDVRRLKKYLATVEDQAVREYIYGAALEEASGEASAEHSQAALLDWLAQTWNIRLEVEGDTTPEA